MKLSDRLSKSATLSCDETLKTRVILRTPFEPNRNVYFQIQSGASVLTSGRFNADTNRLEMDTSTPSQLDLRVRTTMTSQIKLENTSKYNYDEKENNYKSLLLSFINLIKSIFCV